MFQHFIDIFQFFFKRRITTVRNSQKNLFVLLLYISLFSFQFCFGLFLLCQLPSAQFCLVLQFLKFSLHLKNFKFADLIITVFHLSHLLLIFFILLLNLFQIADFLRSFFNLTSHSAILHNTFLKIFNMDILLHANIFLHEIFQFDVHLERNRTFEQSWKFFHIQTTEINVIELFSETFIARSAIIVCLCKISLQIFSYLNRSKTALVRTIIIFQKSAFMPEE